MKLTKENIYINLQGKSKEELTDLYEFLDSVVKKQFVSLRQFLIYCEKWKYYTTESDNEWFFCTSLYIKNKQEVTIQQLKEILQPMETKEFDLKGYSVEVDNEEQAKQLQEIAFKQGFKWYNGKTLQRLNERFFNFNAFNEDKIYYNNKHFKDEYVTKQIHFNDIFKTELTLTEQLEKAEAEVKRLKEAIEEENKIKVGDWVINTLTDVVFKLEYSNTNILEDHYKKITDKELINKLNELIK